MSGACQCSERDNDVYPRIYRGVAQEASVVAVLFGRTRGAENGALNEYINLTSLRPTNFKILNQTAKISINNCISDI